MKIPKEVKRFCPHCKTHTVHKVKQEKNRGKNKTHPLTRGGKIRMRRRSKITGYGNKGSFSRGAMNEWKRHGKKQSKKPDWRLTCNECKKVNQSMGGNKRSKKIIVE